MTVHEVLVGARNRLEQGFIKQQLFAGQDSGGDPTTGPFCARGALIHTITGSADWDFGDSEAVTLRLAAEKQLLLALPEEDRYDVAAYNNKFSTTHKDILAWFDRAIAATAPEPHVELEEVEEEEKVLV